MELKAGDLTEELKPGSVDSGVRELSLKIIPGKRPEVTFTGFWTGKYIKAAMDSIAKGYRMCRRRVILPTQKVVEEKQQIAEGEKV